MGTFTASTTAQAVVAAPRQRIWDTLVDPAVVAGLTPFVRSITAHGGHWTWELSGLEVAGIKVAPRFTERMVLREPERIEFHHDPPAGAEERAGVEGWYALAEAPGDAGRTSLGISLSAVLELPLPRLAAPAVTAAMKAVMATMGSRFSANLLRHLERS